METTHPNNDNLDKIKKLCPYNHISGSHTHHRIEFPLTKNVEFSNSGTTYVHVYERKHIQGIRHYEDLTDIHFKLQKKKIKDITTLFDFFRKQSLNLHVVQIQKGENDPTDLVFISDIDRAIFWIGFYFRVVNTSDKPVPDIRNCFVSKLDFSTKDELGRFLLYEFEYLGYIFEVCPCVK